jgi:hypothetical protein
MGGVNAYDRTCLFGVLRLQREHVMERLDLSPEAVSASLRYEDADNSFCRFLAISSRAYLDL